MYVEQDSFQHSGGDLVHELSESDVNEAYELARRGYQRLRPISETEKTFFIFAVAFGRYTARVIYRISPLIPRTPGQSWKNVQGGFWSSCDQAADVKAKYLIQLVYNVCIQANRQTFDDARLSKFPSTSPSCPDHDDSGFEILPSQSSAVTRLDLHDDGDKERQCTFNNNSDLSSDTDLDTNSNRTKKRKRPSTNEEIAYQVIKKVQLGMQKMKQRKTAFDPFCSTLSPDQYQANVLQAIHGKLEKIRTLYLNCQHVDVETELEELKRLFDDGAKTTKMEALMRHWCFKYFSSCTDIVLRLWRAAEPDRSASAFKFIHFIVNDLVPTEGMKSLAVIVAFAEKTYYLSNVTSVSQDRQLKISKLVADGLRGRLESPPNGYLIPMAVVHVSIVTRLSYRDAFCCLGCPNLARLQFDIAWNSEKKPELAKEYSYLVEEWGNSSQLPHQSPSCQSYLTGWQGIPKGFVATVTPLSIPECSQQTAGNGERQGLPSNSSSTSQDEEQNLPVQPSAQGMSFVNDWPLDQTYFQGTEQYLEGMSFMNYFTPNQFSAGHECHYFGQQTIDYDCISHTLP